MNREREKYRRDIGTVGVTLLVMNCVVGAGIFGLPEILHQAVGTFAPMLMLLGSVLIGSVVMCFAALTSLTDRSGGPQRFVTDAFGRFPGFQIGWLFYFARMVAHAANATVLVTYAAAIWPVLGGGMERSVTIVFVVAAITVLNVVGIRRAVTVLGVITIFKLVPLLLLIGLVVLSAAPPASVTLPQFTAVEGVLLVALYAFVGFENATVPAGEANDPKRAFPRALFIGLALVTLLYFGLQYVYSISPIAGQGTEAPLAALAGHYAGNLGSILIAATVVVSVLGNMCAGHMSGSRMTSALSDDRLIPSWFGHVSGWGTPANSIVFFGIGALLFALTGTFVALAVIGTLARMIVYIASISALPRLRKAAGLEWLSAPIALAAPIGLGLSLWASLQSNGEQWLLIGIFLAVGTLLFAVARWDANRLAAESQAGRAG
jgi:amino acid transporter